MNSSVLTMESLVTASQGFQRYIFAWGDVGGEAGLVESEAIVVMKRSGGLLLALPLDVLPEDVLEQGRLSREEDLVGPSTILSVQGMISDSLGLAPIGATLAVLVVDFKEAVLEHLRLPEEGDEFIVGFSEEDVDAYPHLPELISESLGWLESQATVVRTSSYTPEVTAESGEEGGQTDRPMMQRKAKARPKGAAQPGAEGASPLGKPEKPKKPTTAGLASAVESINSTLEAILKRQQVMEERMQDPPNPTTAALRRPLAVQVAPQEVALASLAKEFQPPKVRSSASLIPLPLAKNEAPQELVELEKEKLHPSGSTLADAMLAQSVALTTLVAQLSSGQSDPLSELTGGSGMGVKGAQGRARLQAELASNKGLFYESVMKAMSRRMFPTLSCNMPPDQMLQLGICGTKYLERYGGYGKFRDLGIIQHQVMTIMDYFQSNNLEGAKDTTALLAVMIEQTVLDHGRMELGQVLCLADDPPASIFSNRSVNALARSKAFSPLADQRWVTTALAYLKELDTITTKRLELTGSASSSSGGGVAPTGAPKPKANPKKKWKPKPTDREREEEEG